MSPTNPNPTHDFAHLFQLPPLTEEDVRELREASARGEMLDIDDAFAQMAGVTREEWLKRVAEHKARYPRKEGQPS